MSFIANLLTRFQKKSAPTTSAIPYLESEFTVAVLELARNRTLAEQGARDAEATKAVPTQL
jgi:hypothetical protein